MNQMFLGSICIICIYIIEESKKNLEVWGHTHHCSWLTPGSALGSLLVGHNMSLGVTPKSIAWKESTESIEPLFQNQLR